MYNNKPIKVSALLVVRLNGDNKIEILNVLAHNKDKYGFPGGKLNEDETPEQAVIRETEEELGVVPTDVIYKDTFRALTPEGRGLEMYVFTGELVENIAANNEIAELHWLTYEQMKDNTHLLTPMTTEFILPLLKTI